ncbi:MAG TPA: hypothetical protein VNO30_13790 [Kofleriaceae bacterium]|nr:hypothetical protein [Kofleriaceae bacterium]
MMTICRSGVVLAVALAYACLSIAGCASDDRPTDPTRESSGAEPKIMLARALEDESFRATLAMLEEQGVKVDLSAGVVKSAGDEIYPEGRALVFALQSDRYEELGIMWDAEGGGARVFTSSPQEPEYGVQSSAGTCGTPINNDNCNYGPWGTNSKTCNNGTTYLYRYEYRTRTWYREGGRTVSKINDWYHCNWMAQPPDCTNQC